MSSASLPSVDLKTLSGVRQFDMTGQVAIITGGSKGLGAAIAAALASAGATTVIASRGGSEAAAIAAEISAGFGARSFAVAVDVTDPASVEQMVRDVMDQPAASTFWSTARGSIFEAALLI